MNILSLVLGILSFIIMFVGIIPCLGAINWLNIPLAVIGLICGIVSASKTLPGQSKGVAIGGIVLCAIAAIIGVLRLMLGGGIV